MNWSEQQYGDYLQRSGKAVGETHAPPFKVPANEAGAFARGSMPPNKMNKTEASYSQHLETLKVAGEILWHRYEPLKLRLADGSYFTPDFGVLTRDCLFELHETKGFWREAARVRIKVAAEIFPFKFIAMKRAKGGGWEREEFS